MQTYMVARVPERLDRVARKLYGTERGGTVELLLSANLGLAAIGPILPVGTRLNVPSRPAAPASTAYPRAWE